MNRFVAKAFSVVLATLHLVFFGAVAVVAFNYFDKDSNDIKDAIYQMGLSNQQVVALLVGGCLGYILIMGVISTFVAINENLEAIRNRTPSSN